MALTNWLMAGARAQSIVLAIEDAHWADPTTLELLRGIAERGALAPLLVVITARQEFRPAWGVRRTTRQFRWCRWTASRCGTWLAGLPLDMRLSKEVVEGVETERTGGVPLFVEEVTRLLLERGEQGGVQAIPPTLQQSLTARLDRLGSAREVAQIGAVIGRDFSYGLLRDVAGIADAALEAALERLADADILLVQGLPPTPTIVSSTRSFRTRPTRTCSRADAKPCTAVSPRLCATASPIALPPNRKTLGACLSSRKMRDRGEWISHLHLVR